MAITLQVEPDNSIPLGVEDCIYYQLLATDYQTSAGNKQSLLIEIEEVGSAQVNSDYITIMGINFVVSDASDYTFATYDGTVSSGLDHANNLLNAIRSNYNFNDLDVALTTLGSTHIIQINTRTNYPLPELVADVSNLTYAYVLGGLTGIAPVYVPGYKIIFQLFLQGIGQGFREITPVQRATPSVRQSDDFVLGFPLEIQDQISPFVKTTVPEIASTWFYDDSCWDDFFLKIGTAIDAEGCGTAYQEFEAAPTLRVFNFASQQDEPDKFEPYYYDAIEQPLAKFLTTQPNTRFACADSYHWLWFYAHIGETLMPGFGLDHYELFYRFYNGTSFVDSRTQAIGLPATDILRANAIVAACGPANMDVTPPAAGTWDNYTVQINATTNGGATNNFISELVHFRVNQCGCDSEQILFLTSKTGYATMECLELTTLSMTSEMNEICREVDCGGTYSEQLLSGKSYAGGRAYERLTFETRLHPAYTEYRKFFADFKASQVRYLLITDAAGNKQWRRILLEPGSLKVWEKDKKITATFTAIYAQDYKRLSEG